MTNLETKAGEATPAQGKSDQSGDLERGFEEAVAYFNKRLEDTGAQPDMEREVGQGLEEYAFSRSCSRNDTTLRFSAGYKEIWSDREAYPASRLPSPDAMTTELREEIGNPRSGLIVVDDERSGGEEVLRFYFDGASITKVDIDYASSLVQRVASPGVPYLAEEALRSQQPLRVGDHVQKGIDLAIRLYDPQKKLSS